MGDWYDGKIHVEVDMCTGDGGEEDVSRVFQREELIAIISLSRIAGAHIELDAIGLASSCRLDAFDLQDDGAELRGSCGLELGSLLAKLRFGDAYTRPADDLVLEQ
jgi:hypothetical protein